MLASHHHQMRSLLFPFSSGEGGVKDKLLDLPRSPKQPHGMAIIKPVSLEFYPNALITEQPLCHLAEVHGESIQKEIVWTVKSFQLPQSPQRKINPELS